MKDTRPIELTQMRDRIFDLANSFAGNQTGVIAGELHESANRITKALRMIDKGVTSEDNKKQLQEWFTRQSSFSVSPDAVKQLVALTSPTK